MRAIGIVLAGGNNRFMRELSGKRAISAMPVAGSYRAIDFTLSSMSHSGIQRAAVLTQYNSRSLNGYLNSPSWWGFGHKQGGLYVLTPTLTAENSDWYRGTADALYQNLDFLKESHEPYVVIASGDGVYKLDYHRVLEYHMEKHADITVVCREPLPGEEVSHFGVLRPDADGRVTEFEENPASAASGLVSCGIYLFRRRRLIELLECCAREDRVNLVRDILIRYRNLKKIYAWRLDTYWSSVASVESYYRLNMDFLKPEVRRFFFREYPDVYTRADDLPPAKYNPAASVKDSIVGNGCIVNGCVEHSVLFKKVYIGSNCIIRNSVILNDVYIDDNTVIENCIVESRGILPANSMYRGEPGKTRVVVSEHDRYTL